MAESESKDIMSTVVDFLQNNIIRQVAFLAGVAASVTLGIYLYGQIQDPMYKPLDYRVTEKNASVIASTLDAARINYKINDADGVVLVASKDWQAAKFRLASSGVQKDDSFNFSYLNDQNAIGESQFLENARYLRALESDLAKTITAIDGVSAARVHIAMPQNATFADESGKPTASVFITMASGINEDKQKVRSIIRIVASSVPGLDPQDVSITDQYGHYLSDSMSPASLESAAEMDYQNDIQNVYEKRIESLIAPMLGDSKMTVKVHADIDFSQQEEATENYDPSKQVVRSEQTTTDSTGSQSASGPAGALANTPPTGGDTAPKSQNTSSQGHSQTIKNYEVGKSVVYRKSNIAKINAISVAVAVDNQVIVDPKTKKVSSQPIPKEKLDQITALVKAAIGYDEKRGDVVTVINSGFSPVTDIPAPLKVAFWQSESFWEMVKKGGSYLFAFIMFIVVYRKANEYYSSLRRGGVTVSSGKVSSKADGEGGITPEMQELKQEQINRLKEIASRDPNRVALVIKNWVGEK
ncbi:MAG TPA: flagellar basal-body MS-ring/collar protein FliF [Gammaproteobacteria bacterium]|nr:flagellar basal-body MS-ring/collar protein FliF [Gammaproteobacteria bacterium]